MALNGSQAGADATTGHLWSFVGREFDEPRLELRVNGKPVDLELKPLEVLQHLLQHAGEVVTKEQLLDAVWPGLAVIEGSLTTAVHKLRKALGDEDSTILVTVPRVGYRLTAPVRVLPDRPSSFPAELDLGVGNPVPGRASWQLKRPLEISSNSDVWLAEHPKTHEQRVFKFAINPARHKALRREVTVFRFLHESLGDRPEFVRILEWNFASHPFFVESEYGGPNLAQWAESQGGLTNIPLQTRLRMLATIAQAVAVAHGAGVLHKDLKPGNVLVSQAADGTEQVKIVDFGSAALLEPSRLKALGITNLGFTQTTDSASPSLTGTLLYLAPEIFCGEAASAATDVYALGVMLYQLLIGDFRRPLSPGWEESVPDPLLRDDIAHAVFGDAAKRLSKPEELAQRLLTLDRRRQEQKQTQQALERERLAEHRRAEARARRPWIVLATVAVLALVVTFYYFPKSVGPDSSEKSVAVLPFQNIGADQSIDFLRIALPDEITTTLSYSRGLSVRQFAATSKYREPNFDLQKAGRELGVRSVVTGHFLKAGEQIQVNVEAIDVQSNRLLWRNTLAVPAGNALTMRRQVIDTARDGLAPALGSSSFTDAAAPPQNAEAYDLYLRSIALANEGAANEEGISMLEKAVALEPNYAPAWYALAMRFYMKGSYGGGGKVIMDRSEAAAARAQAVDPNFILAGGLLVTTRTEQGRLAEAYQGAVDLLRKRPDSAEVHFTMSYVLRYGGALQDAAKYCETARSLDPHNSRWRSCLAVFERLGDYTRAMDFLLLTDPQSQWFKTHLIQLLVRQGKKQEAINVGATNIPGWETYTMLQACAANRPADEIAALAAAIRPHPDAELNYTFGAHLSYCGQTDAALRLLKVAIEKNTCSPSIETDPLYANLRARPEFAEVRATATACLEKFQAMRKQFPFSNSP